MTKRCAALAVRSLARAVLNDISGYFDLRKRRAPDRVDLIDDDFDTCAMRK
jgi:hypothetical protein